MLVGHLCCLNSLPSLLIECKGGARDVASVGHPITHPDLKTTCISIRHICHDRKPALSGTVIYSALKVMRELQLPCSSFSSPNSCNTLDVCFHCLCWLVLVQITVTVLDNIVLGWFDSKPQWQLNVLSWNIGWTFFYFFVYCYSLLLWLFHCGAVSNGIVSYGFKCNV